MAAHVRSLRLLDHAFFYDINYIKNADGDRLYRHEWALASDVKPTALVFIAHGLKEHCRTDHYDQFAHDLRVLGMLAFAHDHVGHGRSGGIPIHVSDFKVYARDVIANITATQARFPGIPTFIVGHSMGGQIAIQVANAITDRIRGVILIAPAIVPDPATATPFKIRLAKMLAKKFPMAGVGNLEQSWLTRNKDMLKKITGDPLNYKGKLRAHMAVSFLENLIESEAKMETVTWPFFFPTCGNGQNVSYTRRRSHADVTEKC